MSEKSFQNYLMKLLPHGYRTSLVNGGGFPDILAIKRNKHFFIELKVMKLGVTGNKKLKSLFKPSQNPWYFQYLKKGGDSLYVMFQLENTYGLLKVNETFCRNINTVKYLDLIDGPDYDYTEYSKLKELVDVNFS